MNPKARSAYGAVARLRSARSILVVLAAGAALYMYWRAHADGVDLASGNGFGSDFVGTIWRPDHAILHGRSPYPSPHALGAVPAVYLPPIYLVTLPLGALPVHLATWIWFAVLVAAAVGAIAVLGVVDPWCHALWILSLPVAESLALGNASILVVLGVALAWRFRDHPYAGPLAAVAAVSIKTWLWPLVLWLLLVRPRSGLRAAILGPAIVLCAWAAIGFHGLLDYPALTHAEAQRFVHGGVLYVSALVQLGVPVVPAAAMGFVAGLALLAFAAARRRSELESLSIALLAALVATPIAWPHYLVLAVIPIAIVSRRLSPVWFFFPALWLAVELARPHDSPVGQSLALCLFAALPAAALLARAQLMRPAAIARQASQSGQP
jgi:hypothetical protein